MPALPNYPAHRQLVAPLRETAQLWRLVAGGLMAFAVYLLCTQVLYRALFNLWAARGDIDPVYALVSGTTPGAMYALLFGFGFMSLGVILARRLVHHRQWDTLTGPLGQALRQFWRVFCMLLLLNAALIALPPWDWGAPFVPNLDPGRWLVLLPLSLLAVLVQAGSEELVFRGYLQQQLAARFDSPVVWMLLPSVMFGLGHYLPEANGSNAGLIALWAVAFGILMADLTARAGTLGPAIAVHLVNNASAMLIVSLPDELSGLSLYLSPFSAENEAALREWLPVDFAMMFVSWLAARLAIRR